MTGKIAKKQNITPLWDLGEASWKVLLYREFRTFRGPPTGFGKVYHYGFSLGHQNISKMTWKNSKNYIDAPSKTWGRPPEDGYFISIRIEIDIFGRAPSGPRKVSTMVFFLWAIKKEVKWPRKVQKIILMPPPRPGGGLPKMNILYQYL